MFGKAIDIIKNMKGDALKRIKNSYLLQAIIKNENISVSEDDVNKEVNDMAKKYNMTVEEVIKSLGGIDAIRYDLEVRRAIDIMKGE